MGPARKRPITHTKRALMRLLRTQDYSNRDVSQWLGCGDSTVSKVVTNRTYGDNLEEDEDYLEGRVGDIVNVDHMSDEAIAQALAAAAIKAEDLERDLAEDAQDEGISLSDSNGNQYRPVQPEGARKSARLRGQKAPYIRTSLSPDICLRANRVHPRHAGPNGCRRSLSEMTPLPDDELSDADSPSTHLDVTPVSMDQPQQPGSEASDSHGSHPRQPRAHVTFIDVPTTIERLRKAPLPLPRRAAQNGLTPIYHPQPLPASSARPTIPVIASSSRAPVQQGGISRSTRNAAHWHLSPFVKRLLEELKPPTIRHAEAFAVLGITTRAHVQTLSLMDNDSLEDLQRELLSRGLTFMDALQILGILKRIREQVDAQASASMRSQTPQTLDAFLRGLQPSLIHHLQIFLDLGAHDENLEKMFKLDVEFLNKFMGELCTKGLSFMECLMVKSACRSRNSSTTT